MTEILPKRFLRFRLVAGTVVVLAIHGLFLSLGSALAGASPEAGLRKSPVTAERAVNPPKKGNASSIVREVQEPSQKVTKKTQTSRAKQKSFAAVFSCSDSGSRPEILTDQSAGGDLLSVRITGNVDASADRRSLDYGLFAFNIPLIAVARHSTCGAAKAVMEAKEGRRDVPSSAKPVTPSARGAKTTPSESTDSGLLEMVINSDAWNSAEQFIAHGKVVPDAVKAGKSRIGEVLSGLTSGWGNSTAHDPKQKPTPRTNPDAPSEK
ncbi:MAG: carbonic anhydrase [Thermodesulfobacteriota bacterium]